jgi:hypothetical protein
MRPSRLTLPLIAAGTGLLVMTAFPVFADPPAAQTFRLTGTVSQPSWNGFVLSADGHTMAYGEEEQPGPANGYVGRNLVDVASDAKGSWRRVARLQVGFQTDLPLAVALSADGTALLGASPYYPGAATVFRFSGGTWVQEAVLPKPANANQSGVALALSRHGTRAVVQGIAQTGWTLWVYDKTPTGWKQTATLPGFFGVFLSADGSRIVTLGDYSTLIAYDHSASGWSGPTTINGRSGVKSYTMSADGRSVAASFWTDVGTEAAEVQLFHDGPSGWRRTGTFAPADPGRAVGFGTALGLSADGLSLVVGSPLFPGAGSGAGYRYVFDAAGWHWGGVVRSDSPFAQGTQVAVSADGHRIALAGRGADKVDVFDAVAD